jgi:DNA polymerase-2
MDSVSALPIQTVARVSPGSGISAMQILTALRQGILVPWHKQQAERPKTALELMHADQGGLVYQPITGLHQDVAEIDFISMYPSIMVHFNISPETVRCAAPPAETGPTAELIPELALYVEQDRPGLVPQTLAPLLQKRLALKARMAELPSWHPRRSSYKAYASAHKWLLVTCFGYLGYKNARFGRIEAHEAVTAFGRETLLRAKEAAEDQGFTVLHMYVDGLWVKKEGLSQPPDFQPLLDEIAARTGLPIALEGVYRWVAFLSSRQDGRVPVANRYFGVFQDSSLKTRGIEARRRDTPLFIAETQEQMLACLAQAWHAGELEKYLPQVFNLLRRKLADLRARKIPMPRLLVSQKLSRTLSEYRSPSPAARAAAQLQDIDKMLKPGQCVRFIYTMGDPGVHAWDLAEPPDPASVDVRRYTTLLIRAASTVLQPLGISEAALRDRLFDNVLATPELWSSAKIQSLCLCTCGRIPATRS